MTLKEQYLRPSAIIPIVVALVAGAMYVSGQKHLVSGPPPTITVSGEGKVSTVPDIASLSFGVQTGRQQTAEAAMEKLSTDMNAIMEAVMVAGVKKKDIRTESLYLNPAYDWDEGARIPRGFEANQSLRVKVRDLDTVGEVLSAATRAGANQAGGVNFTVDDPEELQREARESAIDKAKENARKLAADLGVSLGKLKGFNEGGGGSPQPMYERAMMDSAGMGGGGAPPMPAGEQEIRVTVHLLYEVQ